MTSVHKLEPRTVPIFRVEGIRRVGPGVNFTTLANWHAASIAPVILDEGSRPMGWARGILTNGERRSIAFDALEGAAVAFGLDVNDTFTDFRNEILTIRNAIGRDRT